MNINEEMQTEYKLGFIISIVTVTMAIITFAFAMVAIPISGAFCPNGCIEYPYLDVLKQYPKDFIWMYFATLLSLSYLIFVICIYHLSKSKIRIYSHIGMIFGIISSVILACNYFIQATVIPASLASGDTYGIPLLIQYNHHGLFIAMEEIGFIFMTLSFAFLWQTFDGKNRIEATIRWFFKANVIIVFLSFIILLFIYGLDKKDRFEVIVISVNWLVLIVNGILIGKVYMKKMKVNKITNIDKTDVKRMPPY